VKRAAYLSLGIMLGVSVAAPCVGFAVILAMPSMRNATFVSARDGSTGPAFWLCLWIWAGVTVLGLVLGMIPIVRAALRARREG